MLAPFPEGRALHGLNRLVITVFLIAGLVMLAVAAVKRLPLAAGLFILALNLGLEILAQLDNASFSINALLGPLLLSGLCLSAAWALRRDNVRIFDAAWFLTLLAGLFFGFAVLARLPVVLLLPGLLILLWPGTLRSLYRSAWVAFLSGVFFGGVLPQMIHQSRVAGAWYLSTYGHGDVEPPRLEGFFSNIFFYFGPGKASTENWVLPVIFVGCVGLMIWSMRQAGAEGPATFLPRLSWTRLIVAAFLILAASNAFFLTHAITNHYYQWPALFGAVLLLALGAFALERHSFATLGNTRGLRRALLVVALILSLAPGLIVMGRVWSRYTPHRRNSRQSSFRCPRNWLTSPHGFGPAG